VTSKENIFVEFDIGRPEALPQLLQLERQAIVDSGELVYGKNDLQSEIAIAIYPEIFPLRIESFLTPLRQLRDGGALPPNCHHLPSDSWG
jgi:hypothetical protein